MYTCTSKLKAMMFKPVPYREFVKRGPYAEKLLSPRFSSLGVHVLPIILSASLKTDFRVAWIGGLLFTNSSYDTLPF